MSRGERPSGLQRLPVRQGEDLHLLVCRGAQPDADAVPLRGDGEAFRRDATVSLHGRADDESAPRGW